FGEDVQKPTRQMFGLRGAPGNTIAHATSYWVGKHSTRSFPEKVDIVCGIGYDRYEEGDTAFRFHHIPKVVTNLAVSDFQGPGRTKRAVSLHPGGTAADVAANTGFEVAGLAEAGVTRDPSAEELRLIREVIDPRGIRNREVPAEEKKGATTTTTPRPAPPAPPHCRLTSPDSSAWSTRSSRPAWAGSPAPS